MSTPKPKDDDNVEALAKYLGRAQIDESYGVPTEWKNEDGTNEHRDARFGILQDEVVKKAEDEAKPPPSRPARSLRVFGELVAAVRRLKKPVLDRRAELATTKSSGGKGGIDVATLPEFHHFKLPEERYIRLLRFDDTYMVLSDGTIQKQCHLERYPLDSVPGYITLSYVWGAPWWDQIEDTSYTKPSHNWIIHVDSQPHRMKIGRNLYEALRRMSAGPTTPTDFTLWVDAMCIDQTNLNERSSQVSIMGEIYSKCVRTHIWLGHMEREEAGRIHNVHVQMVPKLLSHVQTHGINAIRTHSWGNDDLARIGISVPQEDIAAYERFLRSARWFSRVWIFQEVVLAPAAVVLLGDLWMPLETMAFLSSFFRLSGMIGHLQQLIPSEERAKLTDGTRPPHPLILLGVFWELGQFLRYADGNLGPLPPPDQRIMLADPTKPIEVYAWVVELLQRMEATDPRDHCYASLGIAQRGKYDLNIAPDYTRDIDKVFTETTYLFLKEIPHLVFLGRPRLRPSKIPNLPSWVVDFTIPTTSLNDHIYDASLCAEHAAEFTLSGSKLILQGASIGKVKRMYIFDNNKRLPWINPSGVQQPTPDLFMMLPAVEHLPSMPHIYPSEDALEVLWRTMSANHTQGVNHQPLSNDILRSYIAYNIIILLNLPMSNSLAPSSALNYDFIAHWHETFASSPIIPTPQSLTPLVRSFERVNKNLHPSEEDRAAVLETTAGARRMDTVGAMYLGDMRCLYVTEEGRVGLGPSTMRIGDEVVFVKGARKLFVMRGVEDEEGGEWEMVGETYVHGQMDGEVVREGVMERLRGIVVR